MLELQTNLLAGMFVLFVLFSVTAGRGKGQESLTSKGAQGTEFLSSVEYLKYNKRKKDLPILHIYIELKGKASSEVKLSLSGSKSIIDSCSLVVSPYSQQRKLWSASRIGLLNGYWGVKVVNSEELKAPITGKVHVFNGTVHTCSKPIIINRASETLIRVSESNDAGPKITISNESCL